MQSKCLARGAARPSFRPAAAARRAAVRPLAAASVSELKSKYDIAGHVEVAEGLKGSTKVVLKHACGSTAEVYLYGACVTSWKQPSGDEVLYVRPDAVFDKSKPISGGIPLCFPQFGPGKIQQHGFARNLEWAIASTSADPQPDERDPEVELVLTENDYTLAMWPHKFKVVYTITLHGEQLRTDFRVINTDDKPFDFAAALHSYFEVLSIDKARITGLKGLTYLDKVADSKNPPRKLENHDAVTFSGPVDSVFLKAPSHVELDVGTGAAIAIDNANWPDAVVWSPWTAMKDCYERFCCLENAAVEPVVLQPGQSWRATTTMNIVDI